MVLVVRVYCLFHALKHHLYYGTQADYALALPTMHCKSKTIDGELIFSIRLQLIHSDGLGGWFEFTACSTLSSIDCIIVLKRATPWLGQLCIARARANISCRYFY
mmetsp:Transcript_27470/g.58036  ORF Transcript_27470/g.58036 Transcript_27470/m.58036 type:complete len:105 (-) Transcript_27470:278-592(-)